MPGIPMFWAWLSGNTPRAISVVTSGIRVSSARVANSFQAPALTTPPPTYSTGRRAAKINFTASLTCLPCGLSHRSVAGQVELARP